MLHRTRFVATLAATLLVFAASPSFAQQSAPDSTAQQKDAAEEEMRRWGVGVRLSKLYGPSVRYALTERFTVQVAGIPVPLGSSIPSPPPRVLDRNAVLPLVELGLHYYFR